MPSVGFALLAVLVDDRLQATGPSNRPSKQMDINLDFMLFLRSWMCLRMCEDVFVGEPLPRAFSKEEEASVYLRCEQITCDVNKLDPK